jgi:hypothetical protein
VHREGWDHRVSLTRMRCATDRACAFAILTSCS